MSENPRPSRRPAVRRTGDWYPWLRYEREVVDGRLAIDCVGTIVRAADVMNA